MTVSKLAVPLLLALGLAAGASAEDVPAPTPDAPEAAAGAPEASAEASAPGAETAASEATPEAAAAEPAPAEAGAEAAPETGAAQQAAVAPAPKAGHEVELGPVGHDAQGRPGRIHVVVRGDTLWDISDAYLGTPWVWPSLWKDNDAIKNPHLIHPGDRIWISPFEMRKVSEAEAAALLAGEPAPTAPAALAETDALPEAKPPTMFHYSGMESTGFVTLEQYEGASTIVESPQPRKWLSDDSEVVIGLGTGQVKVGDQFDIFRTEEKVTDLDTGMQYGWATKQLGWLEVTKVHEESATAMIRHSPSEIQRGDHLLPRRVRSFDIPVGGSPGPIEGRVVHLPNQRMELAQRDVVYLDRGSRQGLAVGNALEIYRRLGENGIAYDEAQDSMRRVPDHVVAKLLVVDVYDDTSVAVVMHTTEELSRGDSFRGSESINP
jgi:hypothetical protein